MAKKKTREETLRQGGNEMQKFLKEEKMKVYRGRRPYVYPSTTGRKVTYT